MARRHGFVNSFNSEIDEITNDAVLKLHRILPSYDPKKGRAFSLLCLSLLRFFISRRQRLMFWADRVQIVPDAFLTEKLSSLFYLPPELSPEFNRRLKGVTTRFSAPLELKVQRFLLSFFLATGEIPGPETILRELKIRFDRRRLSVLISYFVLRLRTLFVEDFESNAELGDTPEWQTLIGIIGEEKARQFSRIFLIRFFACSTSYSNRIAFPNAREQAKMAALSKYVNDPDIWYKLAPDDKRLEMIFQYKLSVLREEEEVPLNPPA
jgi:hypothetical protein